MFKALFHWLDLNPGSYWVLVAAATVPLLAPLWPMIVREIREPGAAGPPVNWRDGLWLHLFLLAWRWPFLPGSALVLRTAPARNGLYPAGLRLQRTPAPSSR